MGTADLRLGDSFKLLLLGAGVGAVGMYVLTHIKSLELKSNWASRRAYPSQFWDYRDPGATPASYSNIEDYGENSIPREGMFAAPDPDFSLGNFSAHGGYTAPANL